MYFYHAAAFVLASSWYKKKKTGNAEQCSSWPLLFVHFALLFMLLFNTDIVWQLSIYGLCLLESTSYTGNDRTEQQEKTFKASLGCFEMRVQKGEFEPRLYCICLKLGVRGCKFPKGITYHEPISAHLPSWNRIQFECINAEGADRHQSYSRWNRKSELCSSAQIGCIAIKLLEK